MKRKRSTKVADATVCDMNKKKVIALIDEQAAKLGTTRKIALRRINKGDTGDNFLWSHISLLAGLLRAAK